MSETPRAGSDAMPEHPKCKECQLPVVSKALLCPNFNCRAAFFLHHECGMKAYHRDERIICAGCSKVFYLPKPPLEKLKIFLIALLLLMLVPQTFVYLYAPDRLPENSDFIQRCIGSIFVGAGTLVGLFVLVVVVLFCIGVAESIWFRVTGQSTRRFSPIK